MRINLGWKWVLGAGCRFSHWCFSWFYRGYRGNWGSQKSCLKWSTSTNAASHSRSCTTHSLRCSGLYLVLSSFPTSSSLKCTLTLRRWHSRDSKQCFCSFLRAWIFCSQHTLRLPSSISTQMWWIMDYLKAVNAEPVLVFFHDMFKLDGWLIVKPQVVKHQYTTRFEELLDPIRGTFPQL